QFGENGLKIDLSVPERTIPSGAIAPVVISTKGTLFPGRIEFGILHVERFDKLMVMIDISDIIQLLQYKMTWIVQDIHPFMVSGSGQKPFKGIPIVQVLPRMDLITDIYPFLIKVV